MRLHNIFSESLQNSPISMSLADIGILFFHSMLAGLLLAASTYYVTNKLGLNQTDKENDSLIGAFNILFLCVGLTGVMILVNNNLIRVFAIVAAIALIRFRVSLSNKGVGASLLFGVMVGMSMGLSELVLGWSIVFVYFVLLTIFFVIKNLFDRTDTN